MRDALDNAMFAAKEVVLDNGALETVAKRYCQDTVDVHDVAALQDEVVDGLHGEVLDDAEVSRIAPFHLV